MPQPIPNTFIKVDPLDAETGIQEFFRSDSRGRPRKHYIKNSSLAPKRVPITARSQMGPQIIDEG